MTDYPIIFSAPMVRALLDGRKTQTRRLAWQERTHVVVCRDGEIVHDPHPDGGGIVGSYVEGCYCIEFLVPAYLSEAAA